MANFNIAYLIELKDRYTKVAEKVAQANQKMTESVSSLEKKMTGFSSNLDKISGKFKTLSNVGKDAFIGWTLPVVGAIGGVVKLGAELEDTRMVFDTMLGSAEKANKMVVDIQQMAAKTPFGTQELLDSAKMMLNFGVAQKDIMKNLKMLGDISGGNKQRFQSLSLAFSQVSSQGRLMGQDLLQMVGAGFNPLQVISEKTGKSMAELKDIMSEGGITFEMVAKAMEVATSKGGRFFNLMEKQSTTFNGLMSTLADNFALAGAKIGEKILPYIKPLVVQLIKFTEGLADLDPKMMMIIGSFAGLSALLPVLMISVGFLGQSFISFMNTITLLNTGVVKFIGLLGKWNIMTKIATGLQMLFNGALLTNPITWLVAGLAILVIVLMRSKNTMDILKNTVLIVWDVLYSLFLIIKMITVGIYDFIKPILKVAGFFFMWLTPIGLVINAIKILSQWVLNLINHFGGLQSIMSKVKGWTTNMKEFLVNVDKAQQKDRELKSNDVSNKNSLKGEITVKAEKGSKVTSIKSKTKGSGNANVGINRAGAGK